MPSNKNEKKNPKSHKILNTLNYMKKQFQFVDRLATIPEDVLDSVVGTIISLVDRTMRAQHHQSAAVPHGPPHIITHLLA